MNSCPGLDEDQGKRKMDYARTHPLPLFTPGCGPGRRRPARRQYRPSRSTSTADGVPLAPKALRMSRVWSSIAGERNPMFLLAPTAPYEMTSSLGATFDGAASADNHHSEATRSDIGLG